MNFNAIILGTDHNSYSVARSFYEAYGKKPIVVGAGVLVPFYKSKIADIYTKKGFSSDENIFISFLNQVVEAREEDDFVFFAPTEKYVDLLVNNQDGFTFSYHIPYPEKDFAKRLIKKSSFYEYLEEIGVRYPRTKIIGRDNIKDLDFDGKVFLKADDYDKFISSSAKNIQKGYKLDSSKKAREVLEKAYDSNYEGRFIGQEYIEGGQGSEYSLNGYRSRDGKVSFVLARNLLSDLRPMWIGNHLVQVDHDDKQMYAISKKIVDSLDYHGLFNLDFKKDSVSGEVFVLEMNIRQGRTFYYSTLAGLNLIDLAIKDLIFDKSYEKIGQKPFRLQAISRKKSYEKVEDSLKKEFNKKGREENSAIHIKASYDDNILRKIKVNESIRAQEKELFD
ncbi:MAG: ATP-grasp domain-containing protein [Anaerococcus sp.]|nr:ATP-grasp domain-containing protein [Anaerococcus sp.]